MRVGNITPVSVDGIDSCETILRRSGNIVVGTVGHPVWIGGIDVSFSKSIFLNVAVEVTRDDGRIINRLYEDADNLCCGIVEVIGNGNDEEIVAEEMRVRNIRPVAIGLINGCATVAWRS